MKSFISALLVLGCLLCTGSQAGAVESQWPDRLELSGWLEAIQSVRTSPPHDSLTSRARLRLELSADMDWLYGFFSADLEKNWEISSQTGVDAHEVWLEHAADKWDIRIGRQIIIWGKADGVQVTDMVSPPDYTEFITRDLDEIRMPVDSVKFRLLGEVVDTEFIWIPVFKAAIQPGGDNPWAFEPAYPDNIQVSSAAAKKPSTTLANSEIGLKVSAYLSGLDLAASLFYTWDDIPALHREVRSDVNTIHIAFQPEHHRLTVFGLEGALPWSDFVFRFEAAYYQGRYHEPASLLDQPLQKDAFRWLGGVDWTPGNDWSVTAQIIGDGIIDHDQRLANPSHALTATLNVSKKFLRQTLTLSNMVYWLMDQNEFFNRAKVEYEVSDGFHLSSGADIFQGEDGQFGMYQDNTQVWVKAKYSF